MMGSMKTKVLKVHNSRNVVLLPKAMFILRSSAFLAVAD